MNKIKTDFLWRALQIFSKQGILFIITFLSAKILSPQGFGVYSYVITIAMFIVLIGDMGISAAMSKYIAQNDSEKSKVASKSVLLTILILLFLLGLFICCMTYLLSPYLFQNYSDFLIFVLPVIIFAPLTSVFDGYYRGVRKFKKLAIISFVNGLLSIFYIYGLINYFEIKGALIAQSIFYLALILSFLFSIKLSNVPINFMAARKVLQYSVVIGLSSIAAFFYSKVDILIMGEYNLVTEIGFYELILQLLTITVLPFSILSHVVSPSISKYALHDIDELKNQYSRYIKYVILIGLITALAFFILSPLAIKHFLSNYNVEKVLLGLSVITFLIPAKIWGVFQTQAFIVSTGNAKVILYTTIVGAILNVALDFIVIKSYGFLGVLGVTLFVHTLNIFVQTVYFKLYLKRI